MAQEAAGAVAAVVVGVVAVAVVLAQRLQCLLACFVLLLVMNAARHQLWQQLVVNSRLLPTAQQHLRRELLHQLQLHQRPQQQRWSCRRCGCCSQLVLLPEACCWPVVRMKMLSTHL